MYHAPQPVIRIRTVAAALIAIGLGGAAALSAVQLGGRIVPPGLPSVAAAPAQTGATFFLPNVQSSGEREGVLQRFGADGLLGIEGFGDSTLFLQNLAAQQANVDVVLTQFETTRTLKRRPAARAIDSFALNQQPGVVLGGHTARVQSDTALGLRARTTWASGAEVAYEAPEAAKELILPLMARNVLSHTTSFYIQNTSGAEEPNRVSLKVFDDTSGGLLREVTVDLDAYGVADYDPAFDPPRFGDLPVNAAGSFVGSIRFSADAPIAVLAYGDELDTHSRGAAAYTARPAASADRVQYLPLVRANQLGDSWIGIANRESSPISVKVSYRGAADSPAGAGQSYEQSFEIGTRGSAFVDLSGRGRGTRAAPGLPRGAQLNRGFYGSAVIEASGRVLAAVVQSTYANGTVITSTTSAAYNAFGPQDLGTRFTLAKARYGTANTAPKSEIVVMNPGSSPANVSISYNDPGQPVAGPSAAVPAGGMRIIALEAKGADKPASISADLPVAVLVHDAAISSASWAKPGHDSAIYWPVRVSGAVTLTPTPTGGATSPPPPSASPTRTMTPDATSTVATATPQTPSPTAVPASPTPTATPTGDVGGLKVFLPVGYRNEKARP